MAIGAAPRSAATARTVSAAGPSVLATDSAASRIRSRDNEPRGRRGRGRPLDAPMRTVYVIGAHLVPQRTPAYGPPRPPTPRRRRADHRPARLQRLFQPAAATVRLPQHPAP